MKIDCDRVLILSDRLAQLSNVCYEKAEEIHIEKLRIAENSLMDEILKNLENDRKQLEEQAEKLKRYGIALKRIVALYAKGESSMCDIMENGSGTQYVFACTLDTDVLNDLYKARIESFNICNNQVVELVHFGLITCKSGMESVVCFALPHGFKTCFGCHKLFYCRLESAVEILKTLCLCVKLGRCNFKICHN